MSSKSSTARTSGRAVHSPSEPPDVLPEPYRTLVAGWRTPPPPIGHPDVLLGLAQIASYLQCCERTVTNWRDEHGLPMCQTHAGSWITTKGLIDNWIIRRSAEQREQFLQWMAAQGRHVVY